MEVKKDRNEEIYQEWLTNKRVYVSQAILARKHGISRERVHQIIEKKKFEAEKKHIEKFGIDGSKGRQVK